MKHVDSGHVPGPKDFLPPPAISYKLRMAMEQLGVKCVGALGEADRFIAHYCRANNVYALVSEDSDFFVLDVDRYIPTSSVNVRGHLPQVYLPATYSLISCVHSRSSATSAVMCCNTLASLFSRILSASAPH